MSRATYYDIAMKEYAQLESMFLVAQETDWYNTFTFHCVQIVEKLMKDILTYQSTEGYLMSSHNIKTLAREINKTYPELFDLHECSWLTDFYTETRYPGEDYVDVDKETGLEVYNMTKLFVSKMLPICESNHAKTNYFS